MVTQFKLVLNRYFLLNCFVASNYGNITLNFFFKKLSDNWVEQWEIIALMPKIIKFSEIHQSRYLKRTARYFYFYVFSSESNVFLTQFLT